MSRTEDLIAAWHENIDGKDVVIIPRAVLESVCNTLAAVDSAERGIWVSGSLYSYFDMLLSMDPKPRPDK